MQKVSSGEPTEDHGFHIGTKTEDTDFFSQFCQFPFQLLELFLQLSGRGGIFSKPLKNVHWHCSDTIQNVLAKIETLIENEI